MHHHSPGNCLVDNGTQRGALVRRYAALTAIVGACFGVACDDSPSTRIPAEAGAETDGPGAGRQDEEAFVDTERPECEALTCEDLDADCGPVSDGCGDVLMCGECASDEVCGLVERNRCGNSSDLCEPLPKSEACAGHECGTAGNGCGDSYDCGSCAEGEHCGIIEAFRCATIEEAQEECPARMETCEEQGYECGLAGDGCGGLLDCDAETGGCGEGELCGAGGVGRCGPADGCEPMGRQEACAGKQCGLVSDGCHGSLDCGGCGEGAFCGAEEPFECAELTAQCIAQTPQQACAGKDCGIVYDGCGDGVDNMIDCSDVNGGCASNEFCGLDAPFRCGAFPDVPCTPAESCAELGWECGTAVDDCGNTFDCADELRTCDLVRETCTGGLEGPALCLSGVDVEEMGGACGLCDAVVSCVGRGSSTELVGRAITAGRADDDTANQVGVPNAFVYILRNNDETELPPIESGVPLGGFACDRCEEQDLGPVLASSRTNPLGEFRLKGDIPVGEEFVLVTKLGKWRRAQKYTLPETAACATTQIPSTATRLPRDMNDGLGVNIPRVAVTTGQIDAMECVFEKMGVSVAEFAEPGADGSAAPRIHLYGEDGAELPTGFTPKTDLHTSLERVMSYDLIVFDCEGTGSTDNDAFDPIIREYVNRGGRMFASHLEYKWINDNGNTPYDPDTATDTGLQPAATWNPDTPANLDEGVGLVSIGRPGANPGKIQDFADWLLNEGAATVDYEIDIIEPRDVATGVGTASEEYLYRYTTVSTTSVQQFAFNTPYGAPSEAICGRVAYSGFHVSSGGDPAAFADVVFPDHCDGTTGLSEDLTDQEKVLLYMLFDVGACVGTGEPAPPECMPVDDCTGRCGELADGCGGLLDCTCDEGEVCAPGGLCAVPGCVATTCEAQDAACGAVSDGCGGTIDCGECELPEVCGGGGVPNQCGLPGCPESCDGLDAECGWVENGCSNGIDCGPCPNGQFCQDHRCIACEPVTCAQEEAECGPIANGCGDVVDCGDCDDGEVCGATQANRCGPCQKLTCAELDAECGDAGDGCGGTLDCGVCPGDEVCGLDEPFKCGKPPVCQPLTCAEVGAECGEIGDGCAEVVNCGECPAGEFCGILEPNKCTGTARAR